MPSGNTALELIKGSLRLIGMIATGETPEPEMSNDALDVLNDLLETMSLSNLAVYGGNNSTYTLTANTGTYTIGASAIAPNFVGPRPVRIPDAFVSYQSVDYPLIQIGSGEYNEIALKTQTGIPDRYTYINDNPLGIIKLWPVPSAAMTLSLNDDRVLTSVAGLTTTIVYPPGYYSYMRHALAVLLASEYGVQPPGAVVDIARASLRDIKRANQVKQVARFDPELAGPPYVDWRTGI